MKFPRSAFGALLILAGAPASAQSDSGLSPATAALADALGRCMVSRTTGEDRIAVARWMLASLAAAPQLDGIAKVDPASKDKFDRGMAALFTRLMTKDCAADAKALFATKERAAFEAAGRPLGMIAMRELLGNSEAMAALGAYTKYIDEADFAALKP